MITFGLNVMLTAGQKRRILLLLESELLDAQERVDSAPSDMARRRYALYTSDTQELIDAVTALPARRVCHGTQ